MIAIAPVHVCYGEHNVGQSCSITNIGFDEHLRDVATIVALFLQPPNTIDLKLCQTLFCMFMVRRGFRKLSAQLQKMCTIWGDSGPIAVMQEWFKECGSVHDIPEHVVEFDGMHSSNGKVRELRDRLARHGVPHIGPCVVTSSNVPGWLATVSAILKELRTLLPMGRQVPPSFEEVPRIYKELGVLDTFLRSSFFKALEHMGVGPALGSKLRERYDKYQSTHMQKWRQEWGKWLLHLYTQPHKLIGTSQSSCVCDTVHLHVLSC